MNLKKNTALDINNFGDIFDKSKNTYPKILGAFSFINLIFIGIYLLLMAIFGGIIFSIFLLTDPDFENLEGSNFSHISENIKNQVTEGAPIEDLLNTTKVVDESETINEVMWEANETTLENTLRTTFTWKLPERI